MPKILCLYIAILFISVFTFRVFKMAQGERLEEIIGGIMIGVLIDFVVFVGFVIAKYKRKH